MAPGESLISPYEVRATPGYLETLKVPLLRGRFFTEGDTEKSPRVVIVDDRLARKFWPGQDPVGRRMFQPDNPQDLTTPGPNPRWYTVVGVVGETKMAGLVTTDDRIGTYYFPMAQSSTRSLDARRQDNRVIRWRLLRRSAACSPGSIPSCRSTACAR